MTPEQKQEAPPSIAIRDIGDKVSDKLQVVKKHARPVVAAAIEVIREHLAAGGRVTLTGLGTFTLRVRKGRIAHNPMQVDDQVEIPTHNVVFFKVCKKLKADVLKLRPGIGKKGRCNYQGKEPYLTRLPNGRMQNPQKDSSSTP